MFIKLTSHSRGDLIVMNTDIIAKALYWKENGGDQVHTRIYTTVMNPNTGHQMFENVRETPEEISDAINNFGNSFVCDELEEISDAEQ